MNKTTSLFLMILFLFTGAVSAQNPQTEELTKLYNAMEFEKTIVKAREFLKDDPQNLDYNAFLGRALVDNGQYAEAIPLLKLVAENDNSWRKAWSVVYLGSAYYLLADYENSKAALQTATQLNITANATKYATRNWLLFGFESFFDNWKTSETKHIRFHFQNMTDPEMTLFMQSREKAFETVNSFFGSVLPKKIDFFVWQSKDDAMKILKSASGFAAPQFCVIHAHFQQTRGHELTHVISAYSGKMLKKTGLINEGTAVCFDLSNNNRQEMVKTWLQTNNQKIDIKDIWNNWGKYPQELSYPLSGLFVEEMISRFGKEKFLAFFTDQTYENALKLYGSETDTMIQEFQKSFN
jgi:tetratricopeptide (TPR) repeat protein